jgi:RNA polymerase sigma-B factor
MASPADRTLLIRWLRQNDVSAREALAARYLPYARALARRFATHGEPLDDLEQVAAIGLLKAIDRYDLERDAALTTYATPTIVGELRRHFRDRVWALHVPRGIQDLATQVTRKTEDLTRTQGRAPTVAELAEALGRSPEEVVEAIGSLASRHSQSLWSGGESEEYDRLEMIGDDDEGYDHVDARLELEPALRDLDERDRLILHLRFVDGLSQSQIATRVGISQMHVSRLLRRSLDSLYEQLSTAP